MKRFAAVAILLLVCLPGLALAQKPTSPDFKVELLFSPPDIEHPSVVTCDDNGNLFVGEDPMDMRGPTTKHFDRVIYIRWDKDGKPVRTVFCDNLAAVFGLIYHDGALYVMHAPLYSVFRDTDGDGVADERKDLASGFGPPAGVYGFNDHIVTGTRRGMDGKVYVSVGDKGIPKAVGADGSTITLEGGGVVRMNLDGTQLEIVTSGTRNHLDVAMDSLDNIFTYDNTDDGLGWWTRFTHHVPTGYYGYPYDYHPHPERHLPRMSEHGGGSPVGAACYREAAWPEKYRDAAFHCEWGKGKVQVFYLKKSGATFTNEMEDFLVKEGSEEFRPQDLCFSPDGKYMYVADWNFGGWVNPKVCGRLFRVSYVGPKVADEPPRAKSSDPIEAQLKSLGHPAHSERMRAQHELARRGAKVAIPLSNICSDPVANKYARIHAAWALAQIAGATIEVDPRIIWREMIRHDPDADVRAQAARILGETMSRNECQVLLRALRDDDASVRMWGAVSLGRLKRPDCAAPLLASLDEKDEFVRHAKIQAIRAIGVWKDAERDLKSDNPGIREAVLIAMAGQYDPDVVAALASVVAGDVDPKFRAKALATLAELYRKADPYEKGWWGTQPAKGKPARSKIRDWECTLYVQHVLRSALEADAAEVRREAMKAVADLKDKESLPIIEKIALASDVSAETRQDALKALLLTDPGMGASVATTIVADDAASGSLVIAALDALVSLKAKDAAPSIERRLAASDAALRAKAIEAYVRIAGNAAGKHVAEFLSGDTSFDVRKAAIRAAGEAGLKDAIPTLLEAAAVPELNQEATLALAAMPDKRALGVYLQGLTSKNQPVREAARLACTSLKEQIGSEIVALHKANELSPEMRRELQAVFTAPAPIREWQIIGGWSKEEDGEPKLDWNAAPRLDRPIKLAKRTIAWQQVTTADKDGRVNLDSRLEPKGDVFAVAYAAIESSADEEATWVLGSDDTATLYVNGEKLLATTDNRGWAPNQNSGAVKLKKGINHIYFVCGNTGGGWEMSLTLRRQSPEYAFLFENVPAELDVVAFREFALKNSGDAKRGQAIFNDLKGVACVKCHAVMGQGGKIGPDLVGVGTKYPREELIRSVLEPSARVAESFQLQTIVGDDGKMYTGVVKSENEQEIELVDANGKSTLLAKDAIEERQRSTISLMPNGLKDGMSLQDFADIVAYLESLKEEVRK